MLTKGGIAKIADVGMALMTNYFSFAPGSGTFSYAAPEVLMGQKCTSKVRRPDLTGLRFAPVSVR